MRTLLFNLFLILSLPLVAKESGPLHIHDAMIPAAPPTMMMRGAFMVIENPTANAIRIVTITSPQFATVELHKTVLKNNVYKMIKQNEFVIPAQGKVELKHGDLHLMLMEPQATLKLDKPVELRLQLDSGQQQVIHVPITSSTDNKSNEHHHH